MIQGKPTQAFFVDLRLAETFVSGRKKSPL